MARNYQLVVIGAGPGGYTAALKAAGFGMRVAVVDEDKLGGVCITVEGGTLKEGEITGLPYQYKDETGNIKFRFLPYYAVERIQNEEKRIFEAAGGTADASSALAGGENRWARNFLTPQERLGALKSGAVCPVIILIDEINRTENTVYKELMNILLTRSVNGYQFP